MMKKLVMFAILLFISGCNFAGQGEALRPLVIGEKAVIDQSKADTAKEIVYSMEEVIETKGAVVDDEIYIAVKVKQFDRFFLDRIRKDAHTKIRKRFPENMAHVSTDKKVYMELADLEKKIQSGEISKKEIEQKAKRIEKFMKG